MAIRQAAENQPPPSEAGPDLVGPTQPARGTPRYAESSIHVQQALAESRRGEPILAGLIESAMDAIISMDDRHRIVLFNPAAEQMFGLSAAEAMGQPIELLLPEEARHRHAEQIRTFARTGVSSRQLAGPGCVHGRRANGEIFQVEASISQIEVKGYRLFTVILRDISRRILDEMALRESEERLALFAATTFEGILVSEGGRIVDCNDQIARMTGYTISELAGRSIVELIAPEDRERATEIIRNGNDTIAEHTVLHKDGSRIFVEAHGKTIPAGSPDGRRLTTVRDITERKRIEQALIEADRRKDEFLAMLAHELRNPLTPIRNAAHVLGRLGIQEPRVQWAQQTIERQVDHLTRLVDELLDVSRIVRGKVTLKMEPVELAGMVNRALEMARAQIDAKGHRVALKLPRQPVHLHGDPVRLAQVVLNLLDNAAKYTPEGGSIEVEARMAGPVIEIQVRDNGIGIPAELLPHVFDLFQQGERSLDRSQGGLGIGLTLVKQLVEMHGGVLKAHSAGAGLGSTFTIWLPTLPETPAADSRETLTASSATAARCRVLVVDDDLAVADSMTVLLELEGHEVRTAASGEVALALARSFHPQLVLLDIGLQGMDGYQVARQLRAQQAADESLCLVAVTGYGHEEARVRSAEAGFDRHLVKPVYPDALLELLAEIGDGANGQA